MYRCTECHTEYTDCPDYCDCGSNTFDEIDIDDTDENEYDYGEYEEDEDVDVPYKKRELTPEEQFELELEAKEKKKSLIAGVVILLLCIAVFIAPPHKKKKMEVVKQKVEQEQVKIPSVDSYWDNSLPSSFKKKDPLANLPLLNTKFNSISPVLRDYLIEIGNEFNRKWDTTIVQGSGECKVEFTINKEGNLNSKRIVATSHNESLDDSVLLVLSNINNFNIPPDDYMGERIYILFKVGNDRSSKVIYPSK